MMFFCIVVVVVIVFECVLFSIHVIFCTLVSFALAISFSLSPSMLVDRSLSAVSVFGHEPTEMETHIHELCRRIWQTNALSQ